MMIEHTCTHQTEVNEIRLPYNLAIRFLSDQIAKYLRSFSGRQLQPTIYNLFGFSNNSDFRSTNL